MDVSGPYREFVSKLEKLFGKFDSDQKRFDRANNSKIARELGYSDAQFSRLINQTATEGEYQRATQNVDRILQIERLEKKLKQVEKPINWKASPIWLITSVMLLIIIIILYSFKVMQNIDDQSNDSNIALSRDHTLRWSFESSFIDPYIKLDDLPNDCNYPCYKYQGRWELDETYKLPFFRERNGFHYLATSVIMYARCMTEKSEKGDIIEGYEYQKHEIWYDKREWPIDSFLTSENKLKDNYSELDFNNQTGFVKVANVHTFFRNEFILDSDSIIRNGKVIGRDLEYISIDKLSRKIKSENLPGEIQSELNRIVNNRLKDFSNPINCNPSPLINEDFNLINDGDKMSFNCQLTTSRFGIDYTKTYKLSDQYIKNRCITTN